MKKEDALRSLSTIEYTLKDLRGKIQATKTQQVTRNSTKALAQAVGRDWFEKVGTALGQFGIPEDVKKKYDDNFTKLLSLSTANSRKKPYLKTIEEVLTDYKDDLVVPVIKAVGQVVSIAFLTSILENVSAEEAQYLDEALGCAANRFFKASIVLGWCAAVHRMHKVVEKLGFDKFNQKSEEMFLIDSGRFKRFKKKFNVHTISELRATVFDNDLLLVLEFWELIDFNQHERLSACLIMRGNAAHPGEAPITPENLASFYSDLKRIVFDNPKFKL